MVNDATIKSRFLQKWSRGVYWRSFIANRKALLRTHYPLVHRNYMTFVWGTGEQTASCTAPKLKDSNVAKFWQRCMNSMGIPLRNRSWGCRAELQNIAISGQYHNYPIQLWPSGAISFRGYAFMGTTHNSSAKPCLIHSSIPFGIEAQRTPAWKVVDAGHTAGNCRVHGVVRLRHKSRDPLLELDCTIKHLCHRC